MSGGVEGIEERVAEVIRQSKVSEIVIEVGENTGALEFVNIGNTGLSIGTRIEGEIYCLPFNS